MIIINRVKLKELINQLDVLSGYYITKPPTADHEFVNVCNGDLRKMVELLNEIYEERTTNNEQ